MNVGLGNQQVVTGGAETAVDNLSSQHISTLDRHMGHTQQLTGQITNAGQAQELRLGRFPSA